MIDKIIEKNPYGLLGVESSVSLSMIRKRSKILSRYLSMDRDFDFDIDFKIYKEARTEKLVKKAAEQLTKPKKRLIYTFFWFNFIEEIDEEVFELIKKNKNKQAIGLWEKEISSGDKSTLTEKNLALFYCLYLFEEKNKDYLQRSLVLWQKLLNSTRFWKAFNRFYELYDRVGTSKEMINNFEKEAEQYVSDIYTELYRYHGDAPLFFKERARVFVEVGEKSKKEVLEPAYADILGEIEKIKEIIKKTDNVISKNEELKRVTKEIESLFKKIKNFNESSEKIKIQQIRDKASKEIRSVGLILHNNFKKSSEALFFIEAALRIVGSDYRRKQFKEDLKIIKGFSALGPIGDLIKDGKYKSALQKIRKKKKGLDDEEMIDFFKNQEKICVLSLSIKKNNRALRLGEKNPSKSKKIFRKSATIIFENIDLFDFDEEVFKNFIVELKNRCKNLDYKNRSLVDRVRRNFIRGAGQKFKKEEEEAVVVLINYYIYGSLSSYLTNRGRDKTIAWISFGAFWLFFAYEPLVALIAIALTFYFGFRNSKPDLKDLSHLTRDCKKCGNKFDPEDKFCTNCGKKN